MQIKSLQKWGLHRPRARTQTLRPRSPHARRPCPVEQVWCTDGPVLAPPRTAGRHTPVPWTPPSAPEAKGLSSTWPPLHLQNEGAPGARCPRLVGGGHADFPTSLTAPRPGLAPACVWRPRLPSLASERSSVRSLRSRPVWRMPPHRAPLTGGHGYYTRDATPSRRATPGSPRGPSARQALALILPARREQRLQVPPLRRSQAHASLVGSCGARAQCSVLRC